MKARRTRPWRISSDTTKLAVFEATAKQMPCACGMIAVLTPITSPRDETRGPPELPGLSAASVWITSSIIRPVVARIERPRAETTPAVTVELEAERVADRHHELATANGLGIAEPRGRQVAGGIGADQRHVGVGVDADELRVGGSAIGVGEADILEAVDDMGVGDDQPVRRDHEARAGTAAHAPISAAYRPEPRRDRPSRRYRATTCE